MAGRGQPTKLTPEVCKAICDSLAAGVDQRHACHAAGVSPRAFQYWVSKGKKRGSPETISLLAAVQKAKSDAVRRNVALIQKAAQDGTWTAAAWWLERRHPDLYGSDRKRVKELERLLAEIIKGGGGAGTTHPPGKKAPRKAKPA
jgi:hypothetical protein